MKLPLTLRWSEQPLGSPCAWLISFSRFGLISSSATTRHAGDDVNRPDSRTCLT